ncbi:MAG TPA: TadE/TadG family type IV pilus assembly protein [Rhizomicrobium sp.]|nr:TadE/TadG family type IV pilus assembly protein [Rhizomicrobium sp.]
MNTQSDGPKHGGTRRRRPLLIRIAQSNQGLAALEFALLAPVLMALLVGLLDFGLAFQRQLQVNAAAQAGASYAVINGFDVTGITNIVTAGSSGIQASPAPTQVCGCPGATSGITTSSPSTPPCTGKCPDGSTAGVYVSANALLSYSTLLPWPGITNPLSLSSTEMVRTQ